MSHCQEVCPWAWSPQGQISINVSNREAVPAAPGLGNMGESCPFQQQTSRLALLCCSTTAGDVNTDLTLQQNKCPSSDSGSLSLASGLLVFTISLHSVPGIPRESQIRCKWPSRSHLPSRTPSSFQPRAVCKILIFPYPWGVLKAGISALVTFFKLRTVVFHSTSVENTLPFVFSYVHFFSWHNLGPFKWFGPASLGWFTSPTFPDLGWLGNWNLLHIIPFVHPKAPKPAKETQQQNTFKPSTTTTKNQTHPRVWVTSYEGISYLEQTWEQWGAMLESIHSSTDDCRKSPVSSWLVGTVTSFCAPVAG